MSFRYPQPAHMSRTLWPHPDSTPSLSCKSYTRTYSASAPLFHSHCKLRRRRRGECRPSLSARRRPRFPHGRRRRPCLRGRRARRLCPRHGSPCRPYLCERRPHRCTYMLMNALHSRASYALKHVCTSRLQVCQMRGPHSTLPPSLPLFAAFLRFALPQPQARAQGEHLSGHPGKNCAPGRAY